MKSNAIFARCFAVGILGVLIAIFLWSENGRADKLSSSPEIPAPSAKQSAEPADPTIHSDSTVTSQSNIESSAETARVEREATYDVMRAKLREWLGTNTGETEMQEALTKELLALLTDENTAEVMRWLSPLEFDTPFGAKALERWLEIDADQAARWISTRTDSKDEHALLVAQRFLKTPADLTVYCDALTEGPWKESVLKHASLEAISQNPSEAAALAQRMTPGDIRTNALETITYAWFGRDLTPALDWIKTVDDPALRERLLAVGAKAIAINDPDLAAGWLMSSVKTQGILNETALSLVETWATQYPQQTANWVARFSDAGPRKQAIDLVLGHWLKSDPASANVWIHTLPEREIILSALTTERAERERAD